MDTSELKYNSMQSALSWLWLNVIAAQDKDVAALGIDNKPKENQWDQWPYSCETENFHALYNPETKKFRVSITLNGDCIAVYTQTINTVFCFLQYRKQILSAWPKKKGLQGGLSFVSAMKYNHGKKTYNGQTLAAYAKSKGANKDTLKAITQGEGAACLVTGHSFTQVQKTDSLLRKTA